jgi:hypothetical protein
VMRLKRNNHQHHRLTHPPHFAQWEATIVNP